MISFQRHVIFGANVPVKTEGSLVIAAGDKRDSLLLAANMLEIPVDRRISSSCSSSVFGF